jgi:mono/diheme cytochrome c family protein
MRKLVLGFAVGIVAVLLGTFIYVRFGFADPRADIPVGTLEAKVAMPSLDAAVDKRAPEVHDPLQPSEDHLLAGIKIYQANCASCHGDIQHPRGMLANALYPRAPQFVQDAPDMPENQNFYIIQHGIRFSGMPAWKEALSENEIWQVTTFLSHMDKLPPNVSMEWKKAAGGTTGQPPASNAPGQKGHTGMKM